MCPEVDQTVAVRLDEGDVGPLASIAEAAVALTVSMQTVRRLIDAGELKAIDVGRKAAANPRANLKVPWTEIRRFLFERQRNR